MIEIISIIASLIAIIGAIWQIIKYFQKNPLKKINIIGKIGKKNRCDIHEENQEVIVFPKKKSSKKRKTENIS